MTRTTQVDAEVQHVLRDGTCVALTLQGYADPFQPATLETPEEGGVWLERVIDEQGKDIHGTLTEEDLEDLETILNERVADSERWL